MKASGNSNPKSRAIKAGRARRASRRAFGRLGLEALESRQLLSTLTTTTLAASAATLPQGQSLTLTATVSDGDPVNGGTVIFTDGSSSIGTGTVTNGTATLMISSLALGPHQLGASYGGTTNDAPSTANSGYIQAVVAASHPADVAVDSSGNLYIVEETNNEVVKVTPGGTTTVVAGNGTSGYSGDGGQATAARLNSPRSVALDSSGNLYIADGGNYVVRKVSTGGVITTVAGNGSYGYSGNGGQATAASIGTPTGVAVDSSGNLYVVDSSNSAIRKVTTGGVITTVAGNGTAGYSGDGSQATAAELSYPTTVAVDASGNLYIVDNGNEVVRKVTTGGVITTVAGTHNSSGFAGDGGPATSAKLAAPYGVAVDSSGDIFISDGNNYRVREVTTDGTINTYAGDGISGNAGDGGPATSASVSPFNVATDSSGDLFIEDFGNNVIREVVTTLPFTVTAPLDTLAVTGITGSVVAGSTQTITVTDYNADNSVNTGYTGTVHFTSTDPNAVLPVDAMLTNGVGTFSVTFETAGTQSVTASSSSGSTSGSEGDIDVTPAAATHFVVTGGSAEAAGGVEAERVTAYDQYGNVATGYAGTVQITSSDGQATLPADATLADGAGTFDVTLKTAGTQSITATDSAFSDINGTQSGLAVTPADASQFLVNDARSQPAGVFATVTVTVTAEDPYGNVVTGYAGTVDVTSSDGSAVLPADATLTDGVGTFNVRLETTGSQSITATDTVTPAITGSETGINIAYPTATTLSVSASSLTTVEQLTLTATVATIFGQPAPDGGTVSFYQGSSLLATSNVTGGTATLTINRLAAGSYAFSAVYSGIAGQYLGGYAGLSGQNTITTVAGDGTLGYTGDGGQAKAAELNLPSGVVFDSARDMYIADPGAHVVRKVTPAGIISTYAGTGTTGFTGDGGQATAARLYDPFGLAIDAAGNLYIADDGSNVVRKVTPGGVISTVAGTGSGGSTGNGGQATAANLDEPTGVAVDASGDIFIADSFNNEIREVTPDGVIHLFAGTGSGGDTGDGGQATAAQINDPYMVAVYGGNVYFTDFGNSKVREVTPDGVIQTVAGTGTGGDTGDGGQATAAEIDDPIGLAFNAVGDLFIADYDDSTVREVTTDGVIHTVAGSHDAIEYTPNIGDGGPGSAAGFYYLQGLAVDAGGNLYIADNYNASIRKLGPDVGIDVTQAPATHFTVTATPADATAGVPQTITVTALDADGNVVTGYTGTVQIISSDGQALLPVNSTLTSGVGTFDVTLKTAGTESITATDTGDVVLTGSDTGVIVTAAPATQLVVTGAIGEVAGGVETVTVTAEDQYGNTDTGYAGTVQITSSDGQAVLPVNSTLTSGVGTFDVTLKTAGTESITAIGTGDPSITGAETGIVVTAAGASHFVVTGTAGAPGGTPGSVTVTAEDPYGNVATGYTGTVHFRSDDSNAVLPGDTTLTAGVGTFRVTLETAGTHSILASDNLAFVSGTESGIVTTAAVTRTSLVASTSRDYVGQSVTLTATVATGAEGLVPTGTVTFKDGTATLGTASLVNGRATFSTTSLAVGNHALSAVYSGVLGQFLAGASGITPSKTITTVVGDGTQGNSGIGGQATAARIYGPNGVASDAAGDLFISDIVNSQIYKVTPAGIITVVVGTGTIGNSGDGGQATDAQISQPAGLVVDSAGNLYFADEFTSTIRKVTPAGIITRFAGNGGAGDTGDGGQATDAEIGIPDGLAMDVAGYLYFTDLSNDVVREVTPDGVIHPLAGSDVAGYGGDSGPATNAALNSPAGLAVDGMGDIFIADSGNHVIREVTPDRVILTVAGIGTAGYSGDGGPATFSQLDDPQGITFDASGDLFISESGNLVVREVTSAGIISTVVGTGTLGYTGDGGPASGAAITNPIALAFDAAGDLFIAETNNGSIREVAGAVPLTVTADPTTTTLSISTITPVRNQPVTFTATVANTIDGGATPIGTVTFMDGATSLGTVTLVNGSAAFGTSGLAVGTHQISAVYSSDDADFLGSHSPASPTSPIATIVGTGMATYSGDGGQATAAAIYGPSGSVYDSAGNLYFSDQSNNVIRKVTPAGVITTVVGTVIGGFFGDGGQATDARINQPTGLAIDAAGDLYISDSYNHRVRMVTPAGIITTVVGNGSSTVAGDGGQATAAGVSLPDGLAFDASGNLYISDNNGQVIREVTPDGVIHTVAGNGNSGSSVDGGPATATSLLYPGGLAVDAAGDLFFANGYSNRIREVTPDGIIHTVAGNGTPGYSGDGGQATDAELATATDVKLDAAGDLFITDSGNNVIRVVTPDGVIHTLAGTGSTGFTGDGGPASAATFNAPFGVTFDAAGDLIIADSSNNVIREITATSPVTVAASGAAVRFAVTGGTAEVAGGVEAVTVTAYDAFGNVATGYDGIVHFTSSDGQAVLPADATLADGVGTFHVTLRTAGVGSIAATDTVNGQIAGSQGGLVVSPAAASGFTVTTLGTSGTRATISVTARDAYGNVATGYAGTLHFTSDDAQATLPGNATLTGGTGTFAVGFATSGIKTVTVADAGDGGLTGADTLTVTQATTQGGSVTSSAPQTYYGQDVTLTATFSAPSAGGSPMTGTVSFYDGATLLGTVSLGSGVNPGIVAASISPDTPPPTISGQASLQTAALGVGGHVIRAVYSGDASYSAATSETPVTVNVLRTVTSTVLGASVAPHGTVLTARVVVTSPGNPSTAGTVSFYEGSVLLGRSTVEAGTATLALGSLSAGQHNFLAVFSGGGSSAASGSTGFVAVIPGQVYLDLNANGVRNAGEPGMAGRLVFLDLKGDGTLDPGDPTATTDAVGNFTLASPVPGTFAVLEAPARDAADQHVVDQVARGGNGAISIGVVPISPIAPVKVVPVPSAASPGTDANAAYVQSLYRSVLGRSGSGGEVDGWLAKLKAGMPRQQVALGFINSLEHRQDEVRSYYATFLHRAPDGTSVNWVNELQAGVPEAKVVEAILDAPEYQAEHRDPALFVRDLYIDVLGRGGESSGVARWQAALASGTARAAVVAGIVESAEADDQQVQSFYEAFLRRPREQGTTSDSWVTRLNAPGGSAGQVEAGLLASPEYIRDATGPQG